MNRLDKLFSDAQPEVASMKGVAYGNAYLALGMLNDQAGRWSRARQYLRRAIGANPRLIGSPSIMRRLFKLMAGQRLMRVARSVSNKAR